MSGANLGKAWRKSSYSLSNGHCLEAAGLQGGRSGILIGVRDSADATSPVLRFEPLTWTTWVTSLQVAQEIAAQPPMHLSLNIELFFSSQDGTLKSIPDYTHGKHGEGALSVQGTTQSAEIATNRHMAAEQIMPLPQLPRSGSTAPRSGNSGRWIDLIAFIAVLALGGTLIAFGHIPVGSLTAVCAALGSLFAVWMRVRTSDRNQPSVGDPHGPLDGTPVPPEPAGSSRCADDLAGKDDAG